MNKKNVNHMYILSFFANNHLKRIPRSTYLPCNLAFTPKPFVFAILASNLSFAEDGGLYVLAFAFNEAIVLFSSFTMLLVTFGESIMKYLLYDLFTIRKSIFFEKVKKQY